MAVYEKELGQLGLQRLGFDFDDSKKRFAKSETGKKSLDCRRLASDVVSATSTLEVARTAL